MMFNRLFDHENMYLIFRFNGSLFFLKVNLIDNSICLHVLHVNCGYHNHNSYGVVNVDADSHKRSKTQKFH